MKIPTTTIALLACHALFSSPASSFTIPPPTTPGAVQRGVVISLRQSSSSNAEKLAEYFAKSHEAKLEAIRAVEEKKNAEIRELKQQIEELTRQKASTPSADPVTDASSASSSPSSSANQLDAYRRFISEYIIKAHNDKQEAVRAAEAATTAKLLARFEGTTPPVTHSLYDKRNARITEAANAGVSRWGNPELQKAGAPPVVVPDTLSMSPPREQSQEDVARQVVAADHGLRADGGVCGPTLAERVMGGSSGGGGGSTVQAGGALYEARNARLMAGSRAGASLRWGDKELAKVANGVAAAGSPADVDAGASEETTQQIQAADHGLRADGGVGGPTLAERVIRGAALAQMTVNAPRKSSALYAHRNVKVLAAAKAGKSRWGGMEVKKVMSLVDNGKEVEDGVVVAAPSLDDRVNMGARLVMH